MYKVIVNFNDLQDKNYSYKVDDTYPREGLTPSEERIAELTGTNNKRGIALIEKAAESKTTRKAKK